MEIRQRILIVDDNKDNLYALERMLSGTGAQVIRASTGNEALIASLNNEFAVAILDVQMPGMDGYELAELLRGTQKTRNLPIIFLSAIYSDDYHVFKGYDAGGVDFIIKPYNPRILINKVRIFLELDRQKEESAEANRQLQREVADREKAEAGLKHAMAELARSNAELDSFAYSVSHDLRAPLRGMNGFSQALLEDYSEILDEQGKDYLCRICSESERMSQLIDDLLNLSRVSRAEIRREPVDLSGIVRTIAAEMERREPDRAVEFLVEEGAEVNGDARLLRLVLENLLGNAWKFTQKRSRAKIEFGRKATNGECAFFVRDNGAGFDMVYAGKLFGAFQRLHSASEFEGTGIGLATVQRIIHRHGGRVWAEGAVGQGASFYFAL
ncbi:response regulator [Candidatus Poribacteria bacterium]|nr:response regulator [Candidatus Poribacteria bacterium]